MDAKNYSCRRHPDDCPHDELTQIGDFCWHVEDNVTSGLFINAPEISAESLGVVYVPVREGPNAAGQHWGWDGNVERPTLTPSINWVDHWHGYLCAGELVSC
jgi:hypothetical protein